MRTPQSHELQRVDEFFAAQRSGHRLRRVLLLAGLIAGGLCWIPQWLPERPAGDAVVTAPDPFAGLLPNRESTFPAPDGQHE